MGDPETAAAHIKRALKDGGTWMVVEPMAGDTLADNLNPVGLRFQRPAAHLRLSKKREAPCRPLPIRAEGRILLAQCLVFRKNSSRLPRIIGLITCPLKRPPTARWIVPLRSWISSPASESRSPRSRSPRNWACRCRRRIG
ncbi:hypothetical protein Pden_1069 [Paracoccus denitrificans PD1222]|uniref:Uncharacterized protein n=1 Tax=Paracoccus denitrificans (strain Pd 1222) TaxID=318586 RepID=A1B0Y4_PARDP|nr:hypothetical protein Pden_1069 [Paracoccus denitrificans PD1222]